ncbi:hypothetical protein CPC08DRAFT_730556 [Agrocybe pediades]|nr:hypothetical protein CPC08DRAFT_730556 [Agrocybe pediades]
MDENNKLRGLDCWRRCLQHIPMHAVAVTAVPKASHRRYEDDLKTLEDSLGHLGTPNRDYQVKTTLGRGPFPDAWLHSATKLDFSSHAVPPQLGSMNAPIMVEASAATPPRLGTQLRPICVSPDKQRRPPPQQLAQLPQQPLPPPQQPIPPPPPPPPQQPLPPLQQVQQPGRSHHPPQRVICIRGRPYPASVRFIPPNQRPQPQPQAQFPPQPPLPSTPIPKDSFNALIPFPDGYNSAEEAFERQLLMDRQRAEELERKREEAERHRREAECKRAASYRRYLAIEDALNGKLKRPAPCTHIIPFNLDWQSSTASSSILSQPSILGSPFSTPSKKPSVLKSLNELQLQLPSPSSQQTLLAPSSTLDKDHSSDDDFYEAAEGFSDSDL